MTKYTHMQRVDVAGRLIGERIPFQIPGDWPEWNGLPTSVMDVRVWDAAGNSMDVPIIPIVTLTKGTVFRFLGMTVEHESPPQNEAQYGHRRYGKPLPKESTWRFHWWAPYALFAVWMLVGTACQLLGH